MGSGLGRCIFRSFWWEWRRRPPSSPLGPIWHGIYLEGLCLGHHRRGFAAGRVFRACVQACLRAARHRTGGAGDYSGRQEKAGRSESATAQRRSLKGLEGLPRRGSRPDTDSHLEGISNRMREIIARDRHAYGVLVDPPAHRGGHCHHVSNANFPHHATHSGASKGAVKRMLIYANGDFNARKEQRAAHRHAPTHQSG
jgi:hypothetical protein